MSLKVKLPNFDRPGRSLREKTVPAQRENEQVSNSSTTNSRNSQAWRDRLQQDPVNLAAHRAKEAVRAKEYRRKKSTASREREKENNRERQRRFYEKRKRQLEDGQFPLTSKKKSRAVVLTRNEREKKRNYDAQKKREERMRMTGQKKRRMKEKDANRKREKRKELKKRQGQSSIVCTSPHHKSAQPNGERGNTSGFKTGSAKRMAISRMWQKIPKDAEQFADIIVDFVKGTRTTPRKRSALEARGLGCRRGIIFGDSHVEERFCSTIQTLKKRSDSASLEKRRLLVYSVMVAKKYRLQSQLAKKLDLRPGYLSGIAKSTSDINEQRTRKRRADATCQDVVEDIQSFYKDPKVSRELPLMRSVVKKQQQQRYIMEVAIQKAYTMWKDENPKNSVVSFSVFVKLRPSCVLLQSRMKMNQCLCEYCTDILLKLQCLNRFLQAKDVKDLKIKDKYDLVSLTMCPKGDDRFHKQKCVDRTCRDCGVFLIRERFKNFLGDHGEIELTWQKWGMQAYVHDGKEKTKKVQITKTETAALFFEELLEETESLAKHLFTANWQQEQFSLIRSKLPNDWSLFVMDFAENFACVSQDEIQSAHWATQQVTVHPTVAYYHCHHPDYSHVVQEALVFLSDDLTHDANAVHHFESLAIKHLTERRELNLNHVVEYTDGCSSQYKSRAPFADISFSKFCHSVSIERCYFGSRHGKGPSDGVSGVVKSAVRRAVISRQVVVNTAEDMFNYCQEALSKDSCDGQRRSFFLVKQGTINRNRLSSEVRTALPGTRSLHSVKCVSPGVLDTRLLTCFCDGCMSDVETQQCSNKEYVIPWQRRALKMVHEVPDEMEPIDQDPDVASDPGNEEPAEKIEDIWKKLTDQGAPMVDGELDGDLPSADLADLDVDGDVTRLLAFVEAIPDERVETDLMAAVLEVKGDDLTRPLEVAVEDSAKLNQTVHIEVMKDYAVFYTHPAKWYIGRVMEPPTEEGVFLKFLEQKAGGNSFSWPRTPDIEVLDPMYLFHGPVNLLGHHPFSIGVEEFREIEETYVEIKRSLHKTGHSS